PLGVAVQRPGQATEVVALHPDTPRTEVGPSHAVATLGFTGTTTTGLRVRRTLEFRADSYRVKATLRVEGSSTAAGPVDVLMYWTTPVAEPGPPPDKPWHTFGEGANRRHLLGRILVDRPGADPEVFEAPSPALKDPKDSPSGPELKDPHLVPDALVTGEHRWAALESDFFIAAVIPETSKVVSRGRARDVAQVGLVFPEAQVAAGHGWEGAGD